jgi:hypothetical protein
MSSKFKVGDQVILGRHDPNPSLLGFVNWTIGMEKYVGKIATLNHLFPLDLRHGYTWGVDIDLSVYAWHEKNMTLVLRIDENIMIVQRTLPKVEGASCSRCHDFNNYAEPNMPDGSFKCFSCRH